MSAVIALAGPGDLAVLTAVAASLGVPVLRWLRRPYTRSEQMAALRRINERNAQ